MHDKQTVKYITLLHFKQQKKAQNLRSKPFWHGADGRGRTDTVSLPRDFESRASANSTTSANQHCSIIITHNMIVVNTFLKFFLFFCVGLQ